MSSKQAKDFSFNSERFRQDPVEVYDELRAHGPIFWSSRMQRWLVTGFNEANQILKSVQFTANNIAPVLRAYGDRLNRDMEPTIEVTNWIPFLHSGQQHIRARKLHQQTVILLRRKFEKAADKIIPRLLAELRASNTPDLMKDFAARIHPEIVCEIMGFHRLDVRALGDDAAADAVFDYSVPIREILSAVDGVERGMKSVLEEVAHKETNPMLLEIEKLMQAEDPAYKDTELAAFVLAFIALGRNTLAAAIGHTIGMLFTLRGGLIKTSDWKTVLGRERDIFRAVSPVRSLLRRSLVDTNVGGQAIVEGDDVLVIIHASNLDESHFAEPLKLSDQPGRNVAFGTGEHLCVGRNWAHMMLRNALIHLSGLGDYCINKKVVDSSGFTLRTVDSIPIQFQRD